MTNFLCFDHDVDVRFKKTTNFPPFDTLSPFLPVFCTLQSTRKHSFIMAIVVGYPYSADYFALDVYLPAIQMRLEIRGGCSCLLQSRVFNYGCYSGHHGGLIIWILWAKYRCTLLKMVCWQCIVLVLTLDQEVCTSALSLFSSLLTWPTPWLTLRSSKFGYFPYYMDCAWHGLTRWIQKRPWKTSTTLFVFVRMPSVYMALTSSDIRLG